MKALLKIKNIRYYSVDNKNLHHEFSLLREEFAQLRAKQLDHINIMNDSNVNLNEYLKKKEYEIINMIKDLHKDMEGIRYYLHSSNLTTDQTVGLNEYCKKLKIDINDINENIKYYKVNLFFLNAALGTVFMILFINHAANKKRDETIENIRDDVERSLMEEVNYTVDHSIERYIEPLAKKINYMIQENETNKSNILDNKEPNNNVKEELDKHETAINELKESVRLSNKLHELEVKILREHENALNRMI